MSRRPRLSEFARAAKAESAELARRHRQAERERPYWRDVPARMDRLARALLAAGTVGDGRRQWADCLCAGAKELKEFLVDAPAGERDRLLTLPESVKHLWPTRVTEQDDGAFGEAKAILGAALRGHQSTLSAFLQIAGDSKGTRAAAIRSLLGRLLCCLFRRCQGHLALKFRVVNSVDGEFYRGPFYNALRLLYAHGEPHIAGVLLATWAEFRRASPTADATRDAGQRITALGEAVYKPPVGDPVAVSQAEDELLLALLDTPVAGADGLRVVTTPQLEERIGGDPSRTLKQLRHKYGGVFRTVIRPAGKKNAGGHRIYIVAAENFPV
jgi:hypothetical protein